MANAKREPIMGPRA